MPKRKGVKNTSDSTQQLLFGELAEEPLLTESVNIASTASENKTKTKPKRPLSTGATGGPPNAQGIEYQVNFALYHTLNFIIKSLQSLSDYRVIMEFRAISEGNIVTRWDIAFQPDDLHIEAKLDPTPDEIKKWLDDIKKGAEGAPQRRFKLVYSQSSKSGSVSLIKAFGDLKKIAEEYKNDESDFQFYVERQKTKNAEEVLPRLGSNVQSILRNAKIECFSEASLKEQIENSARTVASDAGWQIVQEFLFRKLHHAMTERKSLAVNDLIDELRERNIKLPSQKDITLSNYHPRIQSAIFLLENCNAPIPVEVVADAVGCDREQLENLARPLFEKDEISEDNNAWRRINRRQFTHPNGTTILARALESLLSYVKRHKNDESIFGQFDNAFTFAKVCVDSHPRTVVHLFDVFESVLKSGGDLNRVLEVAKLSISAGEKIEGRTSTEAEVVARCYICGTSWAYQRMPGKINLEMARIDYNKSRELAEGINSRTTLAFISKCLGRLCRREVEQLHLADEAKRSKLNESVQNIENAIEEYSSLKDFPLKDHHIGDCHSLLARTYFIWGKLQKVESNMLKAYRLIKEDTKEYADLLILHGDLEFEKRNYNEAESRYTEALNVASKPSKNYSEYRARTLQQRALNYIKMGKKPNAKGDFEKALTVWTNSGRLHNAAEIKYELLLLDNKVPQEARDKLKDKLAVVKVAVIEKHLSRMAGRNSAKAHLSSRAKPGGEYWDHLIREAEYEETIKHLP